MRGIFPEPLVEISCEDDNWDFNINTIGRVEPERPLEWGFTKRSEGGMKPCTEWGTWESYDEDEAPRLGLLPIFRTRSPTSSLFPRCWYQRHAPGWSRLDPPCF